MQITLIHPKNEACIELLTENQKHFLENRKNMNIVAENADWLNLVKKGEEDSIPLPAIFEWSADTLSDKFTLVLSEKSDMSDGIAYVCDLPRCEIYNLKIGKKYYWQIFTDDTDGNSVSSEIYAFTTNSRTPRMIYAQGLSNVRDLGGYLCSNGKRVKQGLIYRGCEMEFHHTITEDGIRVMRDDLKIRTDLDLRIEALDKVFSSALGDSVKFELIPSLAYEKFIADKETCARLFRLLTNKESYPIYFHCWGGADRTGTLALLISAILGVDEEYLYEDYELTSLSIWGKRSVMSYHFTDLLSALSEYGAQNAGMREKCIAYLHACGITDEEMDIIRDILTEDVD